MKTKNSLIYIALCAGLTLQSCDSKLDIDPKQSISSEVALSSESDVRNTLIGAYTVIARGALYGTNLIMIPDLYASNNYVNWTGTFSTYRDISNQNIIATNTDVTRTWTAAYEAINVANTVLASLDVVDDIDSRKEIEGRALFIRGIMHFELVRLYGLPYEEGAANTQLGVPIMKSAVQTVADINKNTTRQTVAEVYTSAEEDLKGAIAKLEDAPTHLYAAKAMLARLYLQQSKFAAARDLANDIIESGDFSLANNLETPFRTKNSSEGIFEIQQSEQSNAGSSNDGLATFYSSYTNATGGKVGRGDLSVNNAFYNTYSNTDKRRTDLIYTGSGAKTGLFSRKWYNYFDNIPVVRLADMYLIRAESNLRLNTAIGQTPLADMNTLRTRAGISSLTAVTLNDILTEREKELAFEGYKLHDYKRTKRTIGSLPYNSPKLVFPIPYREISVNNLLVQNPGY